MKHPAAHHPGPPAPTPQQRLLMLDDDGWESFIEDCVRQLKTEGQYIHVQRLGGTGDKGRDVCGYREPAPAAGTWDLYQAKHYSGPLSPTAFAADLAKFLYHVYSGSYTYPKNYFICASRDVGTKLFDLLHEPEKLRSWILALWHENGGKFDGFTQALTGR